MSWHMDVRPKRWKIWLFVSVFLILGLLYYCYTLCDDGVCQFTRARLTSIVPDRPVRNDSDNATSAVRHSSVIKSKLNRNHNHNSFTSNDLLRRYDVDFINHDVIVFLHMQKTGGTALGKKMVKGLDISTPCECVRSKKKCECYSTKDHVWLFSRYSTGWICGLHADWTELTSCVDRAMDRYEKLKRDRRYLYVTLIRDPINRYISEWKHVRRGATWRTATLRCNGRSPTLKEVPFCYDGEDWRDVTLNEFLDCPHNLATNRQTRMLADLTKINCYNSSFIDPIARDRLLVNSAKENLRNMAYFGILEHMNYSQMLFEDAFNIRFTEDFVQFEVTHITNTPLSSDQRQRIMDHNRLDLELYKYAKELFFERVKFVQHLQKRTPVRVIRDENGKTTTKLKGDHSGDSNTLLDDFKAKYGMTSRMPRTGYHRMTETG